MPHLHKDHIVVPYVSTRCSHLPCSFSFFFRICILGPFRFVLLMAFVASVIIVFLSSILFSFSHGALSSCASIFILLFYDFKCKNIFCFFFHFYVRYAEVSEDILPVSPIPAICCIFVSVAISVMILGFPFCWLLLSLLSLLFLLLLLMLCIGIYRTRVIPVFFPNYCNSHRTENGMPSTVHSFCYHPSDALVFTNQLSLSRKKMFQKYPNSVEIIFEWESSFNRTIDAGAQNHGKWPVQSIHCVVFVFSESTGSCSTVDKRTQRNRYSYR